MVGRKGMSIKLTILIVLLGAVLSVAPLTAQEKVSFPSKNITMIIPVQPGGGMDTYARLLSGYIQKYLPGKPSVLVKNMPGAENAIGINAALSAKPDGHTLVELLIPGNNLMQLLGLANYDLNRLTFIGGMTRLPNVFTVSAKRPERSLKDLQASSKIKPLKSATAGLNSPAAVGSIIAAEVLDMRTEFIPHQGSAPAVLATVRGDADYIVQGYPVLKSSIENGQLIPLWIYSDRRFGHLSQLPTIVELGYPQVVTLFDMCYAMSIRNDVPKEVLSIWREAFKKAVEDPGFAKDMEKAGSYAIYTSPEGMDKVLKDSNTLYAKYKSLLEMQLRK